MRGASTHLPPKLLIFKQQSFPHKPTHHVLTANFSMMADFWWSFNSSISTILSWTWNKMQVSTSTSSFDLQEKLVEENHQGRNGEEGGTGQSQNLLLPAPCSSAPLPFSPELLHLITLLQTWYILFCLPPFYRTLVSHPPLSCPLSPASLRKQWRARVKELYFTWFITWAAACPSAIISC